ncbi:MAG TPA: response regulator [Vicinamibacterales bacterium]
MPPRLLLADDSVTVQRVIELTFADEDINVVSVGSGDEAIARLETDTFDIVLADVGMPGRDGFEVARFVRERPATAHVPVILLTGAYEQVDAARVAASGASAVLPKPFEPQAVIQKVRELLAGRPSPAASPAPAAAASGARPDAGDAVIAPAPPAASSSSVDDYFERLDRAFASLEAATPAPAPAVPQAGVAGGATAEPPGPPQPAAHAAETTPRDGGAAVADPMPASAPPAATPAPIATSGADPAAGLADAFVALLAMEQGEAPPPPVAPLPAVDDEALVERVARRVVERLGDEAVRQLAADIVSRTAERLVREEIERLKQLS